MHPCSLLIIRVLEKKQSFLLTQEVIFGHVTWNSTLLSERVPPLSPPHLSASFPNPILAKLLTFLSYLSLPKNFSSICCVYPPAYSITSSGNYPNHTPTCLPTSTSPMNILVLLVIISLASPGHWQGQTAIKLVAIYFLRKWGSASLTREAFLRPWLLSGRVNVLGDQKIRKGWTPRPE